MDFILSKEEFLKKIQEDKNYAEAVFVAAMKANNLDLATNLITKERLTILHKYIKDHFGFEI